MEANWQPPVELENALHAHLLDGRAIHQHVLFVEPVQRRIAGLAMDDPLPTPLEAALDRMPRASGATEIVPGTDLAVTRARGDAFEPPSADELARVGESLRLLEHARLYFMVELTIGLVVTGAPQAAVLPASTVALDPSHDTDSIARLLLAAATRALVEQWTAVELSFTPREASALHDEVRALATAFADSVLAELARRLAAGKDRDAAVAAEHSIRVAALQARRPDFDRWLTGPPELALSRELICCWYPCWRRSRFIFGGSPFDGLTSLPLANDASAVVDTARAAR